MLYIDIMALSCHRHCIIATSPNRPSCEFDIYKKNSDRFTMCIIMKMLRSSVNKPHTVEWAWVSLPSIADRCIAYYICLVITSRVTPTPVSGHICWKWPRFQPLNHISGIFSMPIWDELSVTIGDFFMVICMIDHIEIFTRYPLTTYMYVRIPPRSRTILIPFCNQADVFERFEIPTHINICIIYVYRYIVSLFVSNTLARCLESFLNHLLFKLLDRYFILYTIAGVIWVKYCWYGVNLEQSINQSINWYNFAWFNLFIFAALQCTTINDKTYS